MERKALGRAEDMVLGKAERSMAQVHKDVGSKAEGTDVGTDHSTDLHSNS